MARGRQASVRYSASVPAAGFADELAGVSSRRRRCRSVPPFTNAEIAGRLGLRVGRPLGCRHQLQVWPQPSGQRCPTRWASGGAAKSVVRIARLRDGPAAPPRNHGRTGPVAWPIRVGVDLASTLAESMFGNASASTGGAALSSLSLGRPAARSAGSAFRSTFSNAGSESVDISISCGLGRFSSAPTLSGDETAGPNRQNRTRLEKNRRGAAIAADGEGRGEVRRAGRRRMRPRPSEVSAAPEESRYGGGLLLALLQRDRADRREEHEVEILRCPVTVQAGTRLAVGLQRRVGDALRGEDLS